MQMADMYSVQITTPGEWSPVSTRETWVEWRTRMAHLPVGAARLDTNVDGPALMRAWRCMLQIPVEYCSVCRH
jgi:hypothetical protein